MKILLIEDEYHAVQYLSGLVAELLPDATLVATLDSVEDAVEWISTNPPPDLALMDVQLADGLSFDIFQQTSISFPVIFTTAYDQYTLEAFKVNSIDYLLKPVEKAELKRALSKYERWNQGQAGHQLQQLAGLMETMLQKNPYRQRFLLKTGKDFTVLHVQDIAYCYSEDGLSFALDRQGKRHVLEQTIEKLAQELDPAHFFRINRSMVVHVQSVRKIHSWFNHRLKLDLEPATQLEVVVSRDRVKGFKTWLDQ
jgi:two-component system response regulator LytT